jgi:hypothetical protein
MPVIPQYQQQTTPGGFYRADSPNVGVDFSGAVDGLRQAAAIAMHRQEVDERKRESDALASGQLALARFENLMAEDFAKRQLKISEENASGAEFTPQFLEDYDGATDELLGTAATPAVRAYLQEEALKSRGRFSLQGMVWETNRGFDFRRDQAAEAGNADLVKMQKDPGLFGELLSRYGVFLDSVNLRAEDRAELFSKVKQSGALYAGEEAAQRDPHGVLKSLHGKADEPMWMKALSAEGRQRVETASQMEINRREQEAREAERLASQRRVEAMYRMDLQRQDALAFAQYGQVAPLPGMDYYNEKFPERAEAQRALDERMLTAHRDIASASLMKPDEGFKFLQDRHGVHTQHNAAHAAPFWREVEQAYGRARKEFVADPVGYMAMTSQKFANEYARFRTAAEQTNDPRVWDKWAQVSDAWQESSGIPQELRRILPLAEAKSQKSALTYNPEKPHETAEQFSQLKARYGDQYARVIREMGLDPSTAIVANMRNETAKAYLGIGTQDQKNLLSSSDMRNLRDRVLDEAEGMIDALLSSPGGGDTAEAAIATAERLAAHYTLNGMSAKDAAKKAVEEVNPDVAYVGKAQIPTWHNGVKTDPQAIMRSADVLLGFVNPTILAAEGSGELAEDQARLAEMLDEDGYWVTAADGNGLEARVDIRGAPRPVLLTTGKRLVISWDDLVAGSVPFTDDGKPLVLVR